MTNEQMWGQDLTEIPGFEVATVENLKKICTEGAAAAYASCL
jgi:tagaturonate reductase